MEVSQFPCYCHLFLQEFFMGSCFPYYPFFFQLIERRFVRSKVGGILFASMSWYLYDVEDAFFIQDSKSCFWDLCWEDTYYFIFDALMDQVAFLYILSPIFYWVPQKCAMRWSDKLTSGTKQWMDGWIGMQATMHLRVDHLVTTKIPSIGPFVSIEGSPFVLFPPRFYLYMLLFLSPFCVCLLLKLPLPHSHRRLDIFPISRKPIYCLGRILIKKTKTRKYAFIKLWFLSWVCFFYSFALYWSFLLSLLGLSHNIN